MGGRYERYEQFERRHTEISQAYSNRSTRPNDSRDKGAIVSICVQCKHLPAAYRAAPITMPRHFVEAHLTESVVATWCGAHAAIPLFTFNTPLRIQHHMRSIVEIHWNEFIEASEKHDHRIRTAAAVRNRRVAVANGDATSRSGIHKRQFDAKWKYDGMYARCFGSSMFIRLLIVRPSLRIKSDSNSKLRQADTHRSRQVQVLNFVAPIIV